MRKGCCHADNKRNLSAMEIDKMNTTFQINFETIFMLLCVLLQRQHTPPTVQLHLNHEEFLPGFFVPTFKQSKKI